MAASLEYLNHHSSFTSLYNHRLLNAIFTGYVAFVCIERSYPYPIPDMADLIINSMEHLLLGIIICMKAAVYFSILRPGFQLNTLRLWGILIAFNISGFVNEFIQNIYKHQAVRYLTFDSKKDILMNLAGSMVFFFMYGKIHKHIQQA
jgi:hypothetical protein